MCGIAGYCGTEIGGDGPRILRRMTDAISYRGPDESGVQSMTDAGLGHVRLSIVGLSDGQQPMQSADGNLVISYNGEVFNYVELRDDLIAQGHRFRSSSDTEVILHLYDEMGPDCVKLLNGDFAFALWDNKRRRMMLARDRMGVRPLFYTCHGGNFFFASEIKALLAVPGVRSEIDPYALDQIFTLWAPIPPRTAFKDIYELPAAHLMLVDDRGIKRSSYWQLDYPHGGDHGKSRSEADMAEELRHLLTDATRIRLRADVPVGSYLSGGLDSSAVSALAARVIPDRLRTFSIGFESAEHDETIFQNQMVEALGTKHSSLTCSGSDIADIFPSVVEHMERPVLRTAPAPLYLLSRLTKEHGYKVVLTGEGADEVFGGYDLFREAKVRRFCARQPHSRMRPQLFRRLYPYLPGLQQQKPEYLAAFFGVSVDDLNDPLYSHRPRFRGTAATKLFFSPELKQALHGYDATEDLISTLPAEYARWHPLNQAQYLETSLLLPGYILCCQSDRMAMAHGVEGRFPFLDHRIVEFGARLPISAKLNGLDEKHILKQAMRGLIPETITARQKQPYRAPDSQSFTRGRLPGYVAELMSPEAIDDGGLFNAGAVGKLLEKCVRNDTPGHRDDSAFVGILSTQLWQQAFAQQSYQNNYAAA
ncbi:asparagine synthase (glutamine-hydrolyzing) [Phyllobacterium sp. 0TCS1.6C]|uniref:asparagine synthase (glutamine-hydrolyzing) n=1 Tax=unclassified Phyllobacterium TaxID=2638441 RepID=UPI002263E9D5|nr:MULTISPECIES: asparagine synthase (glutamine-hydrolyzing) [unclassified Phyllobacterium]MCX8279968.1 asparagine synthase (glutamine-hydrolyzing) [Phyllobacterium sp. 0TCS1.6C]MCX8296135.1 asparagine synthase (glutamine-hydrolyzing) [Phyllobacterium sp. 0TCS1.6A]